MKKKTPAIEIKDKHEEEIMRFENNGDIYLKGRKIDVDKELAQAFTYCVIEMSGFSTSALIEEIKRN